VIFTLGFDAALGQCGGDGGTDSRPASEWVIWSCPFGAQTYRSLENHSWVLIWLGSWLRAGQPGFAHELADRVHFAPRDEVVSYIEEYACAIGAPIRCGVAQQHSNRNPDRRVS
jgi:hypothetical protein